MGLWSDYIDWTRDSYLEYGEAIQESDLGIGPWHIGGDYEAITAAVGRPDKFEHVVAAGAASLVFGNPLVGIISHGGAHLGAWAYDKIAQGISDAVAVDDFDIKTVMDDVTEWVGKPVITFPAVVTREDVAVAAVFTADLFVGAHKRRKPVRCSGRSWRGKRCSKLRGHLSGHSF